MIIRFNCFFGHFIDCKISLIVLFSVFCFQANAQQKNIGLSLSQKVVEITGSELTSINVKINNNNNSGLNATLRIAASKSVQLLSKDKVPVKLSATDSLYVPVKFFVPERGTAESDYSITFYLEDETGVIQEQVCRLHMEPSKSVTMVSLASSVLLKQVGDSINVPVKVSNKGNTLQMVNIVSSFPSVFGGSGFHKSIQVVLPAFKDTLLYITKRVTRELLQFDTFSINVTGIYSNGDLFGQFNIEVQTLKNSYYDKGVEIAEQYQNNYGNSISLTAQNVMSTYSAYQLEGGSSVDLPTGRVGYHIDATMFRNSINKPFLRNTYVSYEANNFGVLAGNITRNFDLNLNGRGGAVFFVDTANKDQYEIGYIDNSFNLIGIQQSVYNSEGSFWGRFEHSGKKFGLKNTFIHNKDSYFNTNNDLIGNELSYILNKNMRLSAMFNIGNTSSFADDVRRTGLLGSINFEGKIGPLFLTSSNLLSTAYYPGNRKGSAIFTERLNYSIGKLNIWAGFNHFNYQPGAIFNTFNFSNDYGSTRSELGFSGMFKQLSISFSPIYQREHSSYFLFSGNSIAAQLRAYRLTTQLSYSTSKQSMFIGIESGFSKNSLSAKDEFQFKVNGNYRYGLFNLSANVQFGSFLINEVLNNYTLKVNNYRSIVVTPMFQKNFFKNRSRVEAGVSYSQSTTAGSSWFLTGRTEYDLSSKTQCFVSLSRNQFVFNQYRYNYNNLQLGIRQKLEGARVGTKYNTLEVFLYKDVNQNGKYDNGDVKAAREVVYVNGTAFVTGDDGKITYKNLKDGNCTISVSNSGKWYVADQRILINKKSTKVEIPLARTGTLKGSISYLFDEFSYDIRKDKEGVTIQAVDNMGVVTKTKTNDLGGFVFYLPAGSYTLFISPDELPAEIECKNNNQTFAIAQEGTEEMMFELAVKARKIETKRFISPFLSKKDEDAQKK